MREALASALMSRGAIAGSRVLDLFAGTGALGFEALSRGASKVVFADASRPVHKGLLKSIAALGVKGEASALNGDLSQPSFVGRLGENGPFDLIFADPPYADIEALGGIFGRLLEADAIAEDAFVVVEHDRKRPPMLGDLFTEVTTYRYGDTAVALFSHAPGPESE